jgi:RNA polymerase sigma-70 factor (ECF subfamily)
MSLNTVLYSLRFPLPLLIIRKMDQTEAIVKYQPLLYAIALRMTGTVQDAEDLVNDTFLNWLRKDVSKVKNTKAYLVRSVINACNNHLSCITRKKEEIFDQIKHSSFIEKIESDFAELDVKHEINSAIRTIVKKLEPAERAIFMLREVFSFEYSDLAELIGKTDENCRKIFSRAKKKLQESDEPAPNQKDEFILPELLTDFEKACKIGEFYSFVDILKKDISDSVRMVKGNS